MIVQNILDSVTHNNTREVEELIVLNILDSVTPHEAPFFVKSVHKKVALWTDTAYT